MTLPPKRIGDKGQRFEVHCYGYPKPGWNVVGWAETDERAETMADAFRQAPSCGDTNIIDREQSNTELETRLLEMEQDEFEREERDRAQAELAEEHFRKHPHG